MKQALVVTFQEGQRVKHRDYGPCRIKGVTVEARNGKEERFYSLQVERLPGTPIQISAAKAERLLQSMPEGESGLADETKDDSLLSQLLDQTNRLEIQLVDALASQKRLSNNAISLRHQLTEEEKRNAKLLRLLGDKDDRTGNAAGSKPNVRTAELESSLEKARQALGKAEALAAESGQRATEAERLTTGAEEALAKSKSDLARVEAQLSEERASSSAEQLRLGVERDVVHATNARLEVELTEAKRSGSIAGSRAEHAEVENTELRTRLTEANRVVAELQEKIQKVEENLTELQNQPADPKPKPNGNSAPTDTPPGWTRNRDGSLRRVGR